MKGITWEELTALEPKLADLLAEAQGYHEGRREDFCANRAWYGYGRNGGPARSLRARVIRLVGWERAPHPVLSTPEAYDAAYQTIYKALPPCGQGCGCL